MPTIIDSLVVELGLDHAKYIKNQKDAAVASRKTKESATKDAKDIEAVTNKAAEAVDRLFRNFLKLYALFTAGREIKGFISDLTSADAALGRLAKNIGTAPDDISAMANAVERSGGSADAAAQSFQTFSDHIQELRATGDSSILPFLYRLQAAGGKTINLNRSLSETFGDIAENLEAVKNKQGIAQANWLGRQLGFDQGTVNLLVQGRAAVNAAIAESHRLGIAGKADTDAAQNLQTSLTALKQASEGLGRTIKTALTPFVVNLLDRLKDWIEANREWIATGIVDKVKEFADWLRSIDWSALIAGIKDFVTWLRSIDWAGIIANAREFVTQAHAIVEALGGWTTAAEAFFALWAGTKFLAVLAAIGKLRAALMIGSGGGILGASGLAAILALLATAKIAGDKNILSPPDTSKSLAEMLLRFLDPGLANRIYGGGTDAAVNGGGGGPGSIRYGGGRGPHGGRRYSDADDADTPRGSGGGTRNAAKTGEMMAYAMDQLRREGVPAKSLRAAAAHLVGQAQMESGLNPNQVHDHGTGYGIYGARLERRAAMFAWLAKHGYARNSAEGQMRYMAHEAMSGRYPQTKRILMNADPDRIGSDTDTVTREFESPAVTNRRSGAVSGAFRTGPTADPNVSRPGEKGVSPGAPSPAPPPQKQSYLWQGLPSAGSFAAQSRVAQALNSTVNDNRQTTTSTNETNIGTINVHTQAQDASTIARDLGPAIRRSSFALAAQYGVA